MCLFSDYVTGYNEGAQQNVRVIRFADVPADECGGK